MLMRLQRMAGRGGPPSSLVCIRMTADLRQETFEATSNEHPRRAVKTHSRLPTSRSPAPHGERQESDLQQPHSP